MKSEELITKAEERISEDRKQLKDLYAKVEKVADLHDEVLGLAAVSEHLVKIADSLTKQTGQLVDLAKLKHKSEIEGTAGKDGLGGEFGSDDAQDIFDAIEAEIPN